MEFWNTWTKERIPSQTLNFEQEKDFTEHIPDKEWSLKKILYYWLLIFCI